MGLYDRDYTQENYQYRFDHAPQMRIGFPRLTPMVKQLLIINVAVFIIGSLVSPVGAGLHAWGELYPANLARAAQIWRLVTYQFLHADFFHILYNMFCLFFLGPILERHYGTKRFLTFYLGCGVAGGVFYMLLVATRFLPALPMVGASGAILGLFAACAILFPQFRIFILPIPVAIPIRVAAVMGVVAYLFFVTTRGSNAGGHAAHLAGMAAGAFYVFSQSWRTRLNSRIRTGARERKMSAQHDLQSEVDRILQKIHDFGIHSLTPSEKKILKRATDAEQMRNKFR